MANHKCKSSRGAPDDWAQLQTLLADSRAYSAPGITLVLGAGIHRERTSNSIAGQTAVNALGSWSGLLAHFARSQSLECDLRVGNLALGWEELAFKFRCSGSAWQRERTALDALQKMIVGFSAVVPSLRKHATQLILDPRFINVINLNIDQCLINELIKKRDRRVWSSQPSHTKRGKRGFDLEKSRAFCSDLERRKVWQPHGDVLRKDSLCLGSRAYVQSCSEFEKYRNLIWAERRKDRSGSNRKSTSPTTRDAQSYKNWADAILHSHLLFVGCGLSSHDADVWFALNCRRRYWMRHPGRAPKTFVVRADDSNADPIPQEYASVLSANNYDEAWKLLGWALTLNGCEKQK